MLTEEQCDASDDDGQGNVGESDLRSAGLAYLGARGAAATRRALAPVTVVGVDAPAAVTRVSQLDALVDRLARHRRRAAGLVADQSPPGRAPASPQNSNSTTAE